MWISPTKDAEKALFRRHQEWVLRLAYLENNDLGRLIPVVCSANLDVDRLEQRLSGTERFALAAIDLQREGSADDIDCDRREVGVPGRERARLQRGGQNSIFQLLSFWKLGRHFLQNRRVRLRSAGLL